MKKVLPWLGAGASSLPLAVFLLPNPGGDLPLPLLISLSALGLIAAFVVSGSLRTGGEAHLGISRLASGTFLGALVMGTIRLAPCYLLAALCFGLISVHGKARRRWRRIASAAVVLAIALPAAACMWPFSLGHYWPVDEGAYLSLDLRAHTILADVPLHDVWAVALPEGSSNGSLRDLDEAMRSYGLIRGTDRVALVAVMGAYFLVSRVLGWHDSACVRPEASVRGRLPDVDGRDFQTPPPPGPFVYHLGNEAMVEIQTCAGHAVYVYAMERTEEGQNLYWAAYALEVGWHTPYYMALIDPIRRLVVFPCLLERFERAWRMRWVRPGGHP